MIAHDGAQLQPLCSHTFPLEKVTDAVTTLGRERPDSRDVVHVTLAVSGDPSLK